MVCVTSFSNDLIRKLKLNGAPSEFNINSWRLELYFHVPNVPKGGRLHAEEDEKEERISLFVDMVPASLPSTSSSTIQSWLEISKLMLYFNSLVLPLTKSIIVPLTSMPLPKRGWALQERALALKNTAFHIHTGLLGVLREGCL